MRNGSTIPSKSPTQSKRRIAKKSITKRCRSGILCTAFCVLFYRVKSAKSDSDFAAVEFWCRGAAKFWLCHRFVETCRAENVVRITYSSSGKQPRDVVFLQSRNCAVPLHFGAQVLLPQNRFALCGFYIVQEDRKAVQF